MQLASGGWRALQGRVGQQGGLWGEVGFAGSTANRPPLAAAAFRIHGQWRAWSSRWEAAGPREPARGGGARTGAAVGAPLTAAALLQAYSGCRTPAKDRRGAAVALSRASPPGGEGPSGGGERTWGCLAHDDAGGRRAGQAGRLEGSAGRKAGGPVGAGTHGCFVRRRLCAGAALGGAGRGPWLV